MKIPGSSPGGRQLGLDNWNELANFSGFILALMKLVELTHINYTNE